MTASRTLIAPLAIAAALAACAPPAPPAAPAPLPVQARLAEIFDDTTFAHAHWGVEIRSLTTGETLYSRNAGRMFMPASNVKLFTGAAALATLGPEFRYRTEVYTSGEVEPDGTLRGHLLVRADGDPTTSGRFYDDPRDRFVGWADSLRAHGITRIAGNVVAVDDGLDDQTIGAGWGMYPQSATYAAEFSGMMFNESAVQVALYPGAVGDTGIVRLHPATGYMDVVNRTRTVAAGESGSLRVTQRGPGPGLLVEGEIPVGGEPQRQNVGVPDPTAFYVTALRETLAERGIGIDGASLTAVDDDGLGQARLLFAYASAPMGEVVTAMMKPSQNQLAEVILKTVGREMRGTGSASAGIAVVDSLFTAWDLPAERLLMRDGSGLSRYNLVAPVLITALLERMRQLPIPGEWEESLPIAGVDGTLRNRMAGTPGEGRVRAKTGTLNTVRALSGYLTTTGGEEIVFSTMINGHLRTAADVDRVVDEALLLLIEAR
jgi:serine-type D-Ala-D-Ala carboxypeptidase/endopeptidase (penicillin-binding protein 4)